MKFDQKYIDSLKERSEELKKMGYNGFTTITDAYLDWCEGHAHCGCDHGCNQFTIENAFKMAALARAAIAGKSQDELDALALKDPNEVAREHIQSIWDAAQKRAEEKRASKT